MALHGAGMTTHVPRARLVRNSRVLRRENEIIDAAAHVFAERGYHGTSTQAIADVLGMRQASLYYYFPSKEAALELVCLRGTDGFVEAAEAVVEGDGTPLEKLARLIAAHLAPIESRRDYVKVFINERRYLPDAEPPPPAAARRGASSAASSTRSWPASPTAASSATPMRGSPCWPCSACAMP